MSPVPRSGSFADSYIGRLRSKIGHDMLHVPGVRSVLENADGDILLHLRSDMKVWSFPGGGPEHGDDVLAQAIRETKEETGLTMLNPKPFGFASDPKFSILHYPNGDVCHYHDLVFHATDFDGELVQQNDESLDVDWFSPFNLPDCLHTVPVTIDAFLRFKDSGEFQFF